MLSYQQKTRTTIGNTFWLDRTDKGDWIEVKIVSVYSFQKPEDYSPMVRVLDPERGEYPCLAMNLKDRYQKAMLEKKQQQSKQRSS